MNKETTEPQGFDKLLAWLDDDREKAGEKYERIRSRLIRIFGCHGCVEPEKLGDETIDRVTLKINWLVENYVGDPVLYFCGVARNVLREDRRDRVNPKVLPAVNQVKENDDETQEYDCLDQCMEKQPKPNRHLVLTYYEGEGQEKITNRRKLADELGITLRALRLRIYHIRLQLRDCMEVCLTQSGAY
jgi:DNA-directed RNA polymerase specialized sigma24 family protein